MWLIRGRETSPGTAWNMSRRAAAALSLAGLSPRFQLHSHPVSRAQSNERLGLDAVSGSESKLPLLRQSGQQQHALHPGKRLADTLPHSGAKGKVGELRSPRPGFRGESYRVEAQRVGEIAGIAVSDELAHQHRRFRGEKEITQLKIVARITTHRPGWGVEPHG